MAATVACSSRTAAARTSARSTKNTINANTLTDTRATATNTAARRTAIGTVSALVLPVTGGALSVAGPTEAIAAAQQGTDQQRIPRVALDLSPQVLHVRVDDPLVALELVTPYPVNEFVAGVHPSRVAGQGSQHAPLG